MYIVTEDVGKSVGIREGWNGGKRLAARCSSEVKDWGNLYCGRLKSLPDYSSM